MSLKHRSRGERIPAVDWNEIVDVVNYAQRALLPNSMRQSDKLIQRRQRGGDAGPAQVAVRWASILAHSGTAPYRYTAQEVVHSGGTIFSTLPGGVVSDMFLNTAELASQECPARHIPNGTKVNFWVGAGGWYLFVFNNAGGVYG